MCGRYALNSSPAKLKEHFAAANEPDVKPRFNIAPSQTAPVAFRPGASGDEARHSA